MDMDASSYYTAAIWLGAAIIILPLVFVYVPPPWVYMVEINLPFIGTIKKPVHPGLKFIPRVPPLVLIKNKLFMADDSVVLTIGSSDGKPGGSGKVELANTSAGVVVQLILRVNDPEKATYSIDDVGQSIPNMPGYKVASINKVEGKIRMLLASKLLKDAMEMVGKKTATGTPNEIDLLKVEVNAEMQHWGVVVIDITIVDFDLPDSVIAQRDKIIAAQKTAEALIIGAQGQREATITLAEGDQRARELRGIGQRQGLEALSATNGGIPTELAMQYQLGERVTEALPNATLILTSGSDGGINIPSAIATADAILNPKGGKQTPPQNPPQPPSGNSGNNSGGNP